MARPKAFDREKAQIQALYLFWRKGYNATSIEDLVETLHLSRSSLYDTFGDKRTLFLDALKLYSKRVLSHVEQTLDDATTPIAGIYKILDELTSGVGTEAGAMGCFMVNSIAELAPYDADVTELAATYTRTFQELLTKLLTQAAEQGALTTIQTPEKLATYVFNVAQGMRIMIKSGATLAQLQAIRDITINSLK